MSCISPPPSPPPPPQHLTYEGAEPERADDREDVGVGEGVVRVGVGHGPPPVHGDHRDGERGDQDVGACKEEKKTKSLVNIWEGVSGAKNLGSFLNCYWFFLL